MSITMWVSNTWAWHFGFYRIFDQEIGVGRAPSEKSLDSTTQCLKKMKQEEIRGNRGKPWECQHPIVVRARVWKTQAGLPTLYVLQL